MQYKHSEGSDGTHNPTLFYEPFFEYSPESGIVSE